MHFRAESFRILLARFVGQGFGPAAALPGGLIACKPTVFHRILLSSALGAPSGSSAGRKPRPHKNLNALRDLPFVELAGICDVDQAKASALASQCAIPRVFSSLSGSHCTRADAWLPSDSVLRLAALCEQAFSPALLRTNKCKRKLE